MTASPEVLPIIDVPLSELAHIETDTGSWKLNPVLAGFRSGATLPPIWLSRKSADSPWWLDDGNHRLEAARHLGHATIRAITATGPEQIAIAERRWLHGTIGLNDADARAYALQLDRQRAAIARCGLAHLFPDLPGSLQGDLK